ncbi:unnamed protein product [Ectocarpus sp. CCAP 1310/34]|nr:unnamed protein product [Ectocarpus sp. CCAP 1310/34]
MVEIEEQLQRICSHEEFGRDHLTPSAS